MFTHLLPMLFIALALLWPAAAAQALAARTAWSYINRANDLYQRGEFERAR